LTLDRVNPRFGFRRRSPSAITIAGVVTRPLTGDVNVTLTATITVGTDSDSKAFPLTVKAQMTDAQAVAAAKATLQIDYASGDSASSVTQNVTLPANGIDGSSVGWSSSDSSVVTAAGVVTQPVVGGENVTLTATITVGAASDTKDFPIAVKPQMPDAQAVAAAEAAMQVGYQPGDAATSVTQNVTLPTSIGYCAVSWTSSDPATLLGWQVRELQLQAQHWNPGN
jgi:Atrophied bacterial Ig domain